MSEPGDLGLRRVHAATPKQGWLLAQTAVALVFCLGTGSARAEPGQRKPAEPLRGRFAVAVDQGVSLPRSYLFNGMILPGIDYGRLRLVADVGAAFENPDWAFLLGLRPSFVLWSPVEGAPYAGLRLVGDASYLTSDSWRLSAGLAVDVESVHLGVLAGYDSSHEAGMVLTTIGFDIPTIFSFVPSLIARKPDCCKR